MNGKLDGRVALVTGSTSGIGRAIAEAFASENAKVVVTGRRDDLGKEVAAGIRRSGGEAAFCAADLSVDEEIERLVDNAVATYGGLDILVNNAGMVPRRPDGSMADGPIHRTEADYWEQMWRIDLRSVFAMCRVGVPYLLSSSNAAIINIASVHGIHGCGMDVYSAVKAAVIGLTRSMAVSYGRRIRVNCISPAMVLVERTQPIWDGNPEMHRQFDEAYLTRMGMPADIAAGCVYLASAAGEYVTGANLVLDGGLSVHGAFPPGPRDLHAALHVGDEKGRSAVPRDGAGGPGER
jgi:NAD(P)-dependent dehydrogenase (short-subunit alcohol dehydrogenase family)